MLLHSSEEHIYEEMIEEVHLYESLESVKQEVELRATCTPETTARRHQETPRQELPRQDTWPTTSTSVTAQKEAKPLIGSEISPKKNPASDLKKKRAKVIKSTSYESSPSSLSVDKKDLDWPLNLQDAYSQDQVQQTKGKAKGKNGALEISAKKTPASYSYVNPKKKRATSKSTYFESSPSTLSASTDKKDIDWPLNLQDAYSQDQVQQTKGQTKGKNGAPEISAKKNPVSYSYVNPKKKRATSKSTYLESSPSTLSADWPLNLQDVYSQDQVQQTKGVSSTYDKKGKAPAQLPTELQACFSSDQKGKQVRKKDVRKLEARRRKKQPAVMENEMADSPLIPPRLYLLDPEFAKEIEELELASVESDMMVGEGHSGTAVVGGGTSSSNSQLHSGISEWQKAAVSNNSAPRDHVSLNNMGEKGDVTGHGSLNSEGKKAAASRNNQLRSTVSLNTKGTASRKSQLLGSNASLNTKGTVTGGTKGKKAAISQPCSNASLNNKCEKDAVVGHHVNIDKKPASSIRAKKPRVQSPKNAVPLSHDSHLRSERRGDSPDGKDSCDAKTSHVSCSDHTVSVTKATGGKASVSKASGSIHSRGSRIASSDHIKVPSLGANLSQKQFGMKTHDVHNSSVHFGSSYGSKPQNRHIDASSTETTYRTTKAAAGSETHSDNIRSGEGNTADDHHYQSLIPGEGNTADDHHYQSLIPGEGNTADDHHYQSLIPHSIHSCEEEGYAEIQSPETRLKMINRKLTDEKVPMETDLSTKGVSNKKMRTELENLFESKLRGSVFNVCKDKVRYI